MLVDLHGKIKALFFSFVHLYYGMTNAIFVSLFNFVHVLTLSYLNYVARFGIRGRKDEEVRGDEPQNGV